MKPVKSLSSPLEKSEKSPLHVAALAAIGSGLEYYDFVIYGMMVKYLGELFFPSSQDFVGIMRAFSIFALGYFVRPIGGAIFGVIADKYGRKKSFTIVMTIMAFSTLGIGALPTYRAIGICSPILLIAFRLLQGISFGAELPSATTLVSESSNKKMLGKMLGLVLSGISLGSLLATLLLALLTSTFSQEQILEGLWRLPFFLGGILAVVAYYIRKNVSETTEFIAEGNRGKVERFPHLLKKNSKKLLIGFGLTLFLATLIITHLYFPVFIPRYFDYSLPQVYRAMSWGMIFSFFSMVGLGVLSDYTCKRTLAYLALLGCFSSLPILKLVLNTGGEVALYLSFIVYQFWISLFFTNYLPILSRLFPAKMRCTAVALTYSVAFSLASTIPTIATYFFKDSPSPGFILYFFGSATAIGLLALSSLTFLYKKSYVH